MKRERERDLEFARELEKKKLNKRAVEYEYCGDTTGSLRVGTVPKDVYIRNQGINHTGYCIDKISLKTQKSSRHMRTLHDPQTRVKITPSHKE